MEQFPNNNKEANMKRSEYEQIQKEVIDFLEQLDEDDRKYILVDYEQEDIEVKFRWEYMHESTSEPDSIFRKIYPDD